MKLENSLEKNIDLFRRIFNKDATVVFRKFFNKNCKDIEFCAIFIDDMIDKTMVNEFVIKPSMDIVFIEPKEGLNLADVIYTQVLPICDVKKTNMIDPLITRLTSGDTILLIGDADEALYFNTRGYETRAISEALSEKTVRGPKQGFVENLGTNLTLVRRKIKSSALKFMFLELGTQSKTSVCVFYMENIVSEEILDEVLNRLDKIKIDGVLDSGYLQELIKDAPYSPYETVGHTERPDIVTSKVLEGRVGILCDGSPFALYAPFIFQEYFQDPEDYYNNYLFASFNRLIRWLGFLLSTSVPAIYVALVTFHQELLPTPLLLSISASRQGTPFPTMLEAILMLLTFEILREAGLRIPTNIGPTVSLVGALVLGQAAVDARLISAPMVIVAAVTGITSFLIPKMQAGLIVPRIVFLLMAGFLGMYGYLIGAMGVALHLMSIRSFSIPYMLSQGALNAEQQKDLLIRAPLRKMDRRPKLIVQKNEVKLKREDSKKESEGQ